MLSFELIQDENRGTWNDVKLFGVKVAEQSWGVKIPLSSYGVSGWSWGGQYFTWGFGGKTPEGYNRFNIKIYNPISVIKSTFEPQISEVRYAIKSFFTVRSGFIQMENKYHDGDEWYWEKAGPNDYDDPYYTCARFGNGRHIPLPILADWDEESNKLQKLAIRLAGGVKEAKDWPARSQSGQ